MVAEIDSKEMISYLHELLGKASSMNEPAPQYPEETINSLYAMAYRFYENGKYEDSVQFFRFLTSLAAYDSKNWTGLGASYQMLKQHEQALQGYAIAAMLNKSDPIPHLHAAECFFALKQIPKGMKALNSAEEIIDNREQYEYLLSRVSLLRQIWAVE